MCTGKGGRILRRLYCSPATGGLCELVVLPHISARAVDVEDVRTSYLLHNISFVSVSYTHLDVYKRQVQG